MNQNLNPKVIICVSTYNGEKYIKNQLKYLYFLQTFVFKQLKIDN